MGIDKILVVDNDFAFVNQLKNGLQKHGQFEIITAPNVKQALRILGTLKISLTVTELDLPKQDGLELLAVLTQKHPNILSIISTANKELAFKKPQHGDSLFSYLRKPFDHVRLHGEIIKVLDCLDEIQFKAGIYTSSILPLIHISKKTCLCEIKAGRGKSGSFYFRKGLLYDATCNGLAGQDALKEMLRWEPVKLWFKDLPNKQASSVTPPQSAPKPKKKSEPGTQVNTTQMPCKVLIVDDSASIREQIRNILAKDKAIQVVGEAENGLEALELIQQTKPDVITLDIKMPVMDGITALEHFIVQSPTPTIVFSSAAFEGNAICFDTIRLGAVDFIAKPTDPSGKEMTKKLNEIKRKIHLAANMRVKAVPSIRPVEKDEKTPSNNRQACKQVICLGGGEGGYAALLKIIPRLSKTLPASCFVTLRTSPQHVDAFIEYLSKYSPIRVKRAKNNLYAEGAACYISSSNEQVSLKRTKENKIYMEVTAAAPAATTHMAINRLMVSMTKISTKDPIGVLLSGSGDDGADGCQALEKAGGITIFQDPDYCLYKDMVINAKAKIKKSIIIPETLIAEAINKICLYTNKKKVPQKG